MPDPDTLSPLRGLHSLREVHVALLSQTMATFSGNWTLERHEGYDGDLTIILAAADATRASYVISRSGAGFHLDTNIGDAFRPLGVFASLGEVMQQLRAREPAPTTANRTA